MQQGRPQAGSIECAVAAYATETKHEIEPIRWYLVEPLKGRNGILVQ